MKTIFITDDLSLYNSINIQCACLGHCSYLRFLKENRSNKIYIDAVGDIKKKHLKKLGEIELTLENFKDLKNDFNLMTYNSSLQLALTSTNKKHKFRLFIDPIGNKMYQLSIRFKRNVKKPYKTILYDSIITYKMIKSLIDNLNTWVAG